MTVIAWDHKIVCADSRGTDSAGGIMVCDKLFRVSRGPHKGHVLATSGHDTAGMKFVEWWVDPKKEQPKIQFEEELFTICVFTPDGAFYADDHCVLVPFQKGPYAIGSGADVAIGAMSMGASPAKAVRIACRWNAFCGLPIQTMRLPERVRK